MKPSAQISLLSQLQKQYTCAITQQTIEQPAITIDGISYEKKQLQTWFKYNKTEPQTKRNLENTQVIPNVTLNNLINKINSTIPQFQTKLLIQQWKITQLQEQLQEAKENHQNDLNLRDDKNLESNLDLNKRTRTSRISKKSKPLKKSYKNQLKNIQQKVRILRQKLQQQRHEKLQIKIKMTQTQQKNQDMLKSKNKQLQKIQETLEMTQAQIVQAKYQISSLQIKIEKINEKIGQKQHQNIKLTQQLENEKILRHRFQNMFTTTSKLQLNQLLEQYQHFTAYLWSRLSNIYRSKILQAKKGWGWLEESAVKMGAFQKIRQDMQSQFKSELNTFNPRTINGVQLTRIMILKKHQHCRRMMDIIRLKIALNRGLLTVNINGYGYQKSSRSLMPNNRIQYKLNMNPIDPCVKLEDFQHVNWSEFAQIDDFGVDINRFEHFVKQCQTRLPGLRRIRFINPQMKSINYPQFPGFQGLKHLQSVIFCFWNRKNMQLYFEIIQLLNQKPELRSFMSVAMQETKNFVVIDDEVEEVEVTNPVWNGFEQYMPEEKHENMMNQFWWNKPMNSGQGANTWWAGDGSSAYNQFSRPFQAYHHLSQQSETSQTSQRFPSSSPFVFCSFRPFNKQQIFPNISPPRWQ